MNCVEINPTPTPSPTPVVPAPTPDPAPADPYAELRTGGPKATIAPAATKKGTKVSVTVSNPYAFAVSGQLQLKRGKKVVAKAKLKLAANATRARHAEGPQARQVAHGGGDAARAGRQAAHDDGQGEGLDEQARQVAAAASTAPTAARAPAPTGCW